MKYIVIIPDGMADYPLEKLGGKTPLEAARKPNMDNLAKLGQIGMTKTVPEGLTPASDVANLSIFGYDPDKFYSGRGPLEAANLGIKLAINEIAFRCNFVTVENDTMVDYSAGHISSEEAKVLIDFLNKKLSDKHVKFYPGISYRNILVIDEGLGLDYKNLNCTAPHDIMEKNVIKNYPKGNGNNILINLMEKSKELLANHDINHVRIDLKENPANMIWLWGQGKTPILPKFKEKYNVTGGVISAVDLIRGMGKILGLKSEKVSGATGYYDTDYQAKAKAALEILENNDFVYIHIESPDEAGHNGNLQEKILGIERIDKFILGPIINALKNKNENFRILVMPDHATPIKLKTHTADDVCYLIAGEGIPASGKETFNEKEAKETGLYFKHAHNIMNYLINLTREEPEKNI
ncbi:MAG: cofactor-independent phosphoglycerate mutase [Candidatus Omnitrophota bacterium]